MNKNKYLLFSFFSTCLVLIACKTTTETTPDPCQGKTIVLTATVVNSSQCASNGTITARASGSTGFTFKIGNGSYSTDSIFKNLPTGTYQITCKDKDGCEKSANFTITENATKGPLYSVVSSLIETKCNQVCHTAGTDGATKGIFATDCDIVNRKANIKTKAIDDTMGALSNNEKQQITDWMNAGGNITD